MKAEYLFAIGLVVLIGLGAYAGGVKFEIAGSGDYLLNYPSGQSSNPLDASSKLFEPIQGHMECDIVPETMTTPVQIYLVESGGSLGGSFTCNEPAGCKVVGTLPYQTGQPI